MRKWGAFLSLSSALFLGYLSGEASWSPPFPIANETAKPEMAISFASNVSHYLVPVMVKDNFTSWSLYGQFLDNNGNKVNKITISENFNTLFPDGKVAFGEDKYLAIWTVQENSTTLTVKGRFIYPNGTQGQIFDIVSGIPARWRVTDVAYGARKFLVIYEKPYTYNDTTKRAIFGKLVSATTEDISGEFQISSIWGRLDGNHIAFDNNTNIFLVAYTDDGDEKKVLARFVSPTDGPLGEEIVIDDNDQYSDNPLAVFFDGQKFLVVWPDKTPDFPNVWQFRGRFVSSDGTLYDPFNITQANGYKILPLISYDGRKFLISWIDGRNCGLLGDIIECVKTGFDIYGRYFSRRGTPLGGEFIITSAPGNEVGGFMGKTQGGKALGLINKNVQLSEIPLAQDVDGRFWKLSIYDIFAPENREKIMANSTYTIKWHAPAAAKKFNISYSCDHGFSWTPVGTVINARFFNWYIPSQNRRKNSCLIKIEAFDANNIPLSIFQSRPFSIEVGRIIEPNGGELLISNQPYTIRWETRGLKTTVAKVQLQYSFNGTTWYNITTINGNPGQTTWQVPVVSTPQPTTRVRIIFRDSNGTIINTMESEGVFTILPPLF